MSRCHLKNPFHQLILHLLSFWETTLLVKYHALPLTLLSISYMCLEIDRNTTWVHFCPAYSASMPRALSAEEEVCMALHVILILHLWVPIVFIMSFFTWIDLYCNRHVLWTFLKRTLHLVFSTLFVHMDSLPLVLASSDWQLWVWSLSMGSWPPGWVRSWFFQCCSCCPARASPRRWLISEGTDSTRTWPTASSAESAGRQINSHR